MTRSFATLGDLVASFAGFGVQSALITFRRDGADTLSYARLAELSARAARQFNERGIGRGDRVALLGPNGPEWVVAYFGIILAGSVAVPLDPQATLDGTVASLNRAAPKAIVTTRAQRDALAPLVAQAVEFHLLDGDDLAALLRGPGRATALPHIDGPDLASLLFTSGTTGTPKAVALTHANFVADLNALLAARLMTAKDRVLLPLPLHHTYPFTVGLLTTLGTGATVVFPAGISGPEILDAVKQGRATALLAVPRLCTALWDGIATAVQARGAAAAAAFRALLAASIALRRHTGVRVGRRLFAGIHARFGGTLELIGCGGAKLPAELAWQLEGLGFRVLTGYGLTETSPVLTFNSPRQSLLGSEGRPLRGVHLRIAGDTAETPGEILARGPSVFTGYWKDTAATAAAFTSDGWFRTGDLGRFDDAGYLHVVGRSKELIVLADGKKFFPETVEKAYASSPLLKEIGVFERDGALAAVVVPNEDEIRARGALRETAALRDAIEEVAPRLPPYERITTYRVVRSALPRTQLGKLRRHLLPGLFAGGEQRPSTPAQATEADRALLAVPLAGEVWRWLCERYPAQPLSLDTSPQLELGIDSLGWVALTVELEHQFGIALRAEQLARILTLRDLLREIEAAGSSTSAPRSPMTEFVEPGLALRLLGAALFATIRLLVRLVFRPAIAGAERLPPGPVLFAPNHASYLDPLVLAAALPWRRLRDTYWAGWVGVMHTTPLRRLLSRAARVFPVDPDRDLAASVRTAQQLLDRGRNIVWFPEGRRSPDGRLQKFQPGVTMLRHDRPISIVPTAITGTFAAWPKHRRWPRRAPIAIVFGTPLVVGAERDAQILRDKLEAAVKELLSSANRVPASRVPELRLNRGAGVTVGPNHGAGVTVGTTAGFEPGAGVTGVDAMTITPPLEVTLRDGRAVTIRPIQRDDSARTAEFIDGLSDDSKHALFLGGVAHVSESELRRLCEPAAARDMAYIATATDAEGRVREVGLCRYAGADAATGAEISVAVADAWQHQGLGKRLLRVLIEHARTNGVRRLYSTDSAGNAAMRRLARDMGFSEERDPDDIHQVIYSLRT